MPTPIRELTTTAARPQEHGKLKNGVTTSTRNGGTRPMVIPTWRFVTPDRTAAEQLAERYGYSAEHKPSPKAALGKMWIDEQGRCDFVSAASEIDIIIPSDRDPLGGTPQYELWARGGLLRRCSGEENDGTACRIRREVAGDDGPEFIYEDGYCQCEVDGDQQCKPATRLSVFLPDMRLGGVWTYSSGSYDVAREFTPMVALLQQVSQLGFQRAKLLLAERRKVVNNKTKIYTVPSMILPASLEEVVAGFGAIGIGRSAAAEQAALAAAAPVAELNAAPAPVAVAEPAHGDDEATLKAEIAEHWREMSVEEKDQFHAAFPDRDNADLEMLRHAVEWLRDLHPVDPDEDDYSEFSQEPF